MNKRLPSMAVLLACTLGARLTGWNLVAAASSGAERAPSGDDIA